MNRSLRFAVFGLLAAVVSGTTACSWLTTPEPQIKSTQPAPPTAKPKKVQYFPVGTQSKIYISARASLPETTAAFELQRAIRYAPNQQDFRHSGGEVIPGDKIVGSGVIVIGDLDSPLVKKYAKELRLQKSDDDEIAQAVIDGNLILAGNSPRAALYSVYDFMYNHLGVRFLWEGADGEFFTKAVPVPMDFFRRYTPAIRFRNLGCGKAKNPDDPSFFLARNMADTGDFRFGGQRYYGGETIQPYRSDFKEHPEYFALRDGVRYLPPPTGWSWVINGCWSNDGFTDLCLKRIREGIVKFNANHISLHPADDSRRCECEECKKLIDPDPSARWFKYNARMLRELKKDFPHLRYSVLAYQEYREVPGCDVEEVEFVEYCQYSRCFVHKVGNPDCGTNKADFGRLQRWIDEKHVPMGVWDYTFDVFQPGFNLPLYDFLADEIKYFRAKKLVKVFLEGGPSVNLSRPAKYVALRLMWDPDLDPDKVLEDYCRAAYGPAGKVMFDFHRACAKVWDAMPAHLTACFNNAGGTAKTYLTKELIALSEKTFADAEKAIEKIRGEDKKTYAAERRNQLKEQYRAALKFERDTFAQWIDLHDKMMKNSVQVNVYKGIASELKSDPGTALKTKGSSRDGLGSVAFRWTDSALLVRVTTPYGENPPAFKLNKDGKGAYGNDSVELFIQRAGESTYRHFAMGRNGDFYDGNALDGKWDAEWSFHVENHPDSWVMNAEIPFAAMGKAPVGGEVWKIVVIRNGKPLTAGLPYPAYHDIGAGAELLFSDGKRPE